VVTARALVERFGCPPSAGPDAAAVAGRDLLPRGRGRGLPAPSPAAGRSLPRRSGCGL